MRLMLLPYSKTFKNLEQIIGLKYAIEEGGEGGEYYSFEKLIFF